MASCIDCRWWSSEDWKRKPAEEGSCMAARTEPDGKGHARPLVAGTRMRAVGNGGSVAASLLTHGDFFCAQYLPR